MPILPGALLARMAALAGSPEELIAWRAVMGVGGALIFPATLAILVNVFTVPKHRAAAIAVWAATSGLAVALGPVLLKALQLYEGVVRGKTDVLAAPRDEFLRQGVGHFHRGGVQAEEAWQGVRIEGGEFG